MPTVQIYADDVTGGGINSSNASYASTQAGSSLSVIGSSASPTIFTGQDIGYVITQFYAKFTLTSLLYASIINGATFSVCNNGDFTNATGPTWRLRQFEWGASLDTGDWINPTTFGGSQPLLATFPSSSLPGFGYVDFSSSGNALRDAIRTLLQSPSGVLRTIMTNSRLEAGTVPTGTETAGWVSDQQDSTGLDPYLTVDYSVIPPRQRVYARAVHRAAYR